MIFKIKKKSADPNDIAGNVLINEQEEQKQFEYYKEFRMADARNHLAPKVPEFNGIESIGVMVPGLEIR